MQGRLRSDSLVYLLLLLVSVIMALPLVWMVLSSFKMDGEIDRLPITFLPQTWVLDNYTRLPEFFPIALFFLNSVHVATAVTAAVLLTSSWMGFVLAKFRFTGSNAVFVAILATMMVPGIITLIPVFLIINSLHLVNTLWGVMLPGLVSPFGIFLMRQFMNTVPDELMYAARVDGCSDFRLFFQIMLPLCGPALSALGIFTFLGTWDGLLWPLVVLNDSDLFTVPIGLAYFAQRYWSYLGLSMAGATLALLPVMIVYLLFQKQFVKGISLTGLAGM